MSPDNDDPHPGWSRRGPADVSGLLMELARAHKGHLYYAEGDPARAQLLDGAFLAWQIELERSGPLELRWDASAIHATGLAEPIARAPCDALVRAFETHGLEQLTVWENLGRESLHALLDLLCRSPEYVAQCGGLARALSERSGRGLTLNGDADPEAPEPLTEAAPTTLGSALLGPTQGLIGLPGTAKPTLEEDPLLAPATDQRGEGMRLRLAALDATSDDEHYRADTEIVVNTARELFQAGSTDECYRAILVLADHAVGQGGRSGVQARIAHEACARLCGDDRMAHLISRACASDAAVGIRASRVLLQLGEPAANHVFETIASDADETGATQLIAILITLGDHAIPCLMRALSQAPPAQAARAAALCAELQNPALAPHLATALVRPGSDLRKAAASALTQLSGPDAGDALLNGLGHVDSEIAEVSAHGLGRLADERFVLPILAALDRSERRKQYALTRACLTALGRIGSRRAIPRLVRVLQRGRLFHRRERRELQRVAADALAAIEGDEALRALQELARKGDRAVRAQITPLIERRAAHLSDVEEPS